MGQVASYKKNSSPRGKNKTKIVEGSLCTAFFFMRYHISYAILRTYHLFFPMRHHSNETAPSQLLLAEHPHLRHTLNSVLREYFQKKFTEELSEEEEASVRISSTGDEEALRSIKRGELTAQDEVRVTYEKGLPSTMVLRTVGGAEVFFYKEALRKLHIFSS